MKCKNIYSTYFWKKGVKSILNSVSYENQKYLCLHNHPILSADENKNHLSDEFYLQSLYNKEIFSSWSSSTEIYGKAQTLSMELRIYNCVDYVKKELDVITW